MIGIILLSLVPLRTQDNEYSEMSSQLLFGERVAILEERERWLFVRNLSDDYTGWVDRKMITILPEDLSEELAPIAAPLTICRKGNAQQQMLLTGASLFHRSGEWNIAGETYRLSLPETPDPSISLTDRLVAFAKQYLNAPYLWGGKSMLGIDCSGFVQVVFSVCGVQLPRDAAPQAATGKAVETLVDSQVGDLAFFDNAEGEITHVGMLLNNHQIIHASGWVKIEAIDSKGIISSVTGEYTHKLCVIRRVI